MNIDGIRLTPETVLQAMVLADLDIPRYDKESWDAWLARWQPGYEWYRRQAHRRRRQARRFNDWLLSHMRRQDERIAELEGIVEGQQIRIKDYQRRIVHGR